MSINLANIRMLRALAGAIGYEAEHNDNDIGSLLACLALACNSAAITLEGQDLATCGPKPKTYGDLQPALAEYCATHPLANPYFP